MYDNDLYGKLIGATNKIVKQFGRGIIYEERFVNILSDLCPERDYPALYRIIKYTIQDDLLNNVLNSNIKGIEHQVAAATSTLIKQYGYDKSLVEGILFSLAIGYGTITTAQYNALKVIQNNPTKKQPNSSSQKNNPYSAKPNKHNNISNHPPIKYDSVVKHTAILLCGIFGLLVSPIVYALLICEVGMWPLYSSIFIALIHFCTILPVSISFESSSSIKASRVHPILQGGFCALYILAIFFWLFFPLLWGIESVQEYWGYFSKKEGFPGDITIVVNLFFAMFIGIRLNQGTTNFSVNLRKNQGRFSNDLWDLFGINKFRYGFCTVFLIFVIVGFVFYCIPIVQKSNYKHKIEVFNQQIEALNLHSDSLRNIRSQSEKNLSFAKFYLGESLLSFVSKIESNDQYTAVNMVTYKGVLSINEIDYISIVDTIMHLRTNWNNEEIIIDVYFARQKIIALQFAPTETSGDSILSFYTAKYGEPETHLTKLESSEYDNLFRDNDIEVLLDYEFVPTHFLWTYKNSLIKIDYDKRGYSSLYGAPAEDATITYFDRKAELLLKQYKEEQTKKARISEIHRQDSLRHVREAEQRRREEQKRLEELNHQRSMQQI